MLKIIHASDIHIEAKHSWLGRKAAGYRSYLWKLLERTVNLALEKNVQMLLFCGDVFDNSHPDKQNVVQFFETVKPAAEKGVKVLVLPGNHDIEMQGGVWSDDFFEGLNYEINKNIVILNSKIKNKYPQEVLSGDDLQLLKLPELNCNLIFSSVANKENKLKMKEKLEDIEKVIKSANNKFANVIMMHGSVMEDNQIVLGKDEISKLKRIGVGYVAMGDWHGYLDLSPNEDTLKIVYPGSFLAGAVDQKEAGNVSYAEISEDGCKQERINISEIKVINEKININQIPPEKIKFEIAKIKNKNVIAGIEVQGEVGLEADIPDFEEIEREISEEFYFLKIKNKINIHIKESDMQNFPPGTLQHEIISDLQQKIKNGEVDESIAQEVLQLAVRMVS